MATRTRKSKFNSEEERLASRRASARKAQKKYYQKHSAMGVKLKWLEEKGFESQKEYRKTTPSYQASLKNNEPGKFKTLYQDKPETTKQHPIFTDYYVDTEGNVWKFSTKRCSWLQIKTQLNKSGYYTIQLYLNDKRHVKYHHRIVAEAWIGLCPKDKEVDHIDSDKSNNKPNNLQYLTRADNCKKRTKWKWVKK